MWLLTATPVYDGRWHRSPWPMPPTVVNWCGCQLKPLASSIPGIRKTEISRGRDCFDLGTITGILAIRFNRNSTDPRQLAPNFYLNSVVRRYKQVPWYATLVARCRNRCLGWHFAICVGRPFSARLQRHCHAARLLTTVYRITWIALIPVSSKCLDK